MQFLEWGCDSVILDTAPGISYLQLILCNISYIAYTLLY